MANSYLPLRQPLIAGHKTSAQVTRDICAVLDRKPTALWWGGFLVALLALVMGAAAVSYQIAVGIGVWGLNRTVGWAFDITNFVFWVGIGHGGTLISAVLFLLRQPCFLLNFLLNWAVPFLVLLHVPAKRSRGMLLKVCWVILVGRWVDLYLMILPPVAGEQPVFGVWEIGLMLGAASLFFLALFHVLPKANVVPVRDPFLAESLTYHN